MEITKIKKDEIVRIGHEALGKVRYNHPIELDNITLTLAMIIGNGLDSGYKIKLPFAEFTDFSDLIIRTVREKDLIAVISIPPNTPMNVLNKIRGLIDNSIHTITNIDKALINESIICLIGIKPDRREEYAVDYATRLL